MQVIDALRAIEATIVDWLEGEFVYAVFWDMQTKRDTLQ